MRKEKPYYNVVGKTFGRWQRHGNKNLAYRLDRKDNSLGYIPGNVVGCCTRCNYAKGDRYSYIEWYAMSEPFRTGKLPQKEPYIRSLRRK
jgi:hypothetical protein